MRGRQGKDGPAPDDPQDRRWIVLGRRARMDRCRRPITVEQVDRMSDEEVLARLLEHENEDREVQG